MRRRETPGLPQPVEPKGVQRFGEYLLLSRIAQGGMAEIFLAKRTGPGGFAKNVVIKRMLGHLSISPEFVAMFFDEARLAAMLDHPNIAQISDFGVVDGFHYICMEYIAGEDLRAIIRRCREQGILVPLGIALLAINAVCEGLQYAHSLAVNGRPLGIVHRDISPANVMVSYHGVVKLVDFGIAKVKYKASVTEPGNLKGKIAYLSPEQVKGGEVDERTDVWALGLTLFEVLTNNRVFRRSTELSILHAIVNDRITLPSEMRPDLPREVDGIVAKALERDPDKRYQNAAAMRADLEGVLAMVGGGVASRDLAAFMLRLFGHDRMQGKTFIPTTRELPELLFGADLSETHSAPIVPDATHDADDEPAANNTASAATRVEPVQKTAPRWMRRRELFPAIVAIAALVLASASAGWVWMGRPRPVAVATVAPTAPAPPPVITPQPVTPAVSPLGGAGAPEPARLSGDSPVPRGRRISPSPPPRSSLTSRSVALAMERAHASLLGCFKQHGESLPRNLAEGKVTFELVVLRSGAVRDAKVNAPGLSASPIAPCLAERVKKIRFPGHQDPEVRISVPFVYRVY